MKGLKEFLLSYSREFPGPSNIRIIAPKIPLYHVDRRCLAHSQVYLKKHWQASRKPLRWCRRHPVFNKSWSTEAAIPRKGPPTRTFPNGVPFFRIRKFQQFAGRSWKINTGRRKRM
ncbi:hypothetical protein XU18_4803 [Perkinsela sp. CCAP 1560/4]|nr:hypothetical protein XU18_4803 [Perkinsela sp. CCAP 1560/4]|eukprot:KNH03849.1 hypothetical protein XU18_4803 [Perkinsela sp. CCAP 1560/4]